MESSKGRKRKHSLADSNDDNTSSEVILNPDSSHAVTNIAEDIDYHAGCATDKCPDTGNVISSSSSSINTVVGARHKPYCFSELPEAVMQNIYRCLPLNDLLTVGNVCDSWKQCTDRASVWKHVPFKLCDSNIENLAQTPYIHTITGCCSDTKLYVNAIINNLQDLRRLHISFDPYISTMYVQKLIQKFVNLESITLDPSAPDIIKTLAVLENCTKLKYIHFEYRMPYGNNQRIFMDAFCKIKSIDTFNFFPLCHYVNTSDVLYFLELKMKQLVSLRANVYHFRHDVVDNISTIMSKIICDSERLENLEFLMENTELPADIILNFAEIKKLKSLILWFSQPNILAQVTFPTSLQFLNLSLPHIPDSQRILQRVIDSCLNLKYLNAACITDKDIDEQLEQINRLQNLDTIILKYCKYLSGQGLQYISKCSKLRVLKLTKASLDDAACNSLKSCKYLQEIKFENCNVKAIKLVQTKLYLERLTHLSLVRCYRKIGRKKVQYSRKYLKRIL